MMNDAELARNFHALAHPRRARLFRLLAYDPGLGARQDRLAEAAGLGWGSFSHHMKVLERAGLVVSARRGANVAYALATGDLARALQTAARLTARQAPARAA